MTWLTRITNLFLPEQARNIVNDDVETLRISILIAIVSLPIISTYGILYHTYNIPAGMWTCSVGLSIMLASLYSARSTGPSGKANHFFVSGIIWLIVAGIWVTGGIGSPNLLWLLPLPFLGFLLIGFRSAIYISIMMCIFLAFFYFAKDSLRYPHIFSTKEHQLILTISSIGAEIIFCFFVYAFMLKHKKLMNLVEEKNDSIRTIVENVQSGFLIVNRNGIIEHGYSKSCLGLFELDIGGKSFAGLLAKDETEQEFIDESLQQIFAGLLPLKVCLAQIPVSFDYNNRKLSILPSPLFNEKKNVTSILFTVNDITEITFIEKENQINSCLVRILSEQETFYDFLTTFKNSTDAILKNSLTKRSEILATLHTLKGNAAIFGLKDLVAKIHEIEGKTEISMQDVLAIKATLKEFLEDNFSILRIAIDEDNFSKVHIEEHMLDLCEGILEASANSPLKTAIAHWLTQVRAKSLFELLSGYEKFVVHLASEYNKPARTKVVGRDLKIDIRLWNKINIHIPTILRNAFVHGLEGGGNLRKEGLITFAVKPSKNMVTLEISDNGQGLDLNKIRSTIIERKLRDKAQVDRLSDEEIIAFIFQPGFSTHSKADLSAGRGLGIYAVQKDMETLGGSLSIRSTPKAGTTVCLEFPLTSS